MDENNRNLILATALSFIVILVWFVLFPPPEPAPVDPNAPVTAEETTAPVATAPATAPATADTSEAPAASETTQGEAARLPIDTGRVEGSVSLLGGRIDDLRLKDYRETQDPGADIVTALSPVGTQGAYYALYGWAPGSGLTLDDVPGANTLWQVESGDALSADSPVRLIWENTKGQVFRREIAIDDDYMFTVTQSVENQGTATAAMAPYGVLARHGEPEDLKNFFILHEGVVGMADGELTETDYGDMPDFSFDDREGARAEVVQVEANGWIGFTDHYWMTTLIPAAGSPFKSVAK